MIRTIIFDIGNVLSGFGWKDFYESKGYTGERLERLAAATTKSDDWVQFDKGCLQTEQIIDLFVENDPGIEMDIRKVLADVSGMMKHFPYAIPWIKALKAAGYQVLVLSNFSEKVLQDCWGALDFLPYTDGGILSFQDKLVKPDPAIYHLLLYRYHLNPQECVFIDDMSVNVEGAKALGIHGICFKDRAQAVRELNGLGVYWEE